MAISVEIELSYLNPFIGRLHQIVMKDNLNFFLNGRHLIFFISLHIQIGFLSALATATTSAAAVKEAS
jgi:hypothetical protein